MPTRPTARSLSIGAACCALSLTSTPLFAEISVSGATSPPPLPPIGDLWNLGEGSLSIGGPNGTTGGMTIDNGSRVLDRRGLIGEFGSGTVVVEGEGSEWINSWTLDIARSGFGSLTIREGGFVSADVLFAQFGGPSSGTSTITFGLGSADPLMRITSSAVLGGSVAVSLDAGTTLSLGDAFTLIALDNSGFADGSFANGAEGSIIGNVGGFDIALTYFGGDGNDVVAYVVPAPGVLGMMCAGGLCCARRSRRST